MQNKPMYRSGLKQLARIAEEFECGVCHQQTVVLAAQYGWIIACNNPKHRSMGIVHRPGQVYEREVATEKLDADIAAGKPMSMSVDDALNLWRR